MTFRDSNRDAPRLEEQRFETRSDAGPARPDQVRQRGAGGAGRRWAPPPPDAGAPPRAATRSYRITAGYHRKAARPLRRYLGRASERLCSTELDYDRGHDRRRRRCRCLGRVLINWTRLDLERRNWPEQLRLYEPAPEGCEEDRRETKHDGIRQETRAVDHPDLLKPVADAEEDMAENSSAER